MRNASPRLDLFEIQHLVLRVYLGLDFVHHFAEKFGLLGPDAYAKVLDDFRTTTPAYSAGFVLGAGLCEFAACLGFTFGLFTRGRGRHRALPRDRDRLFDGRRPRQSRCLAATVVAGQPASVDDLIG